MEDTVDKFTKPQIICHAEKNLNFSLFDAKWIPCSAKFVVLGSQPNSRGIIQIYEICKGELKLINEFGRKTSFKCGTFGASNLRDRHLATGDFDGKLQVFDLEKFEKAVYSCDGHVGIINSIDGIGGITVGCGAPEIITGGRDGSVKVWDVRQAGAPVAHMQAKEGEKARECWAVAAGNSYNSEERVVVSGYDNGDIKMFDLRNMSVRWEVNIKNGVCGLEFDRKDIMMNKLVATALEGKIHVWDLRTQHEKKGFAGLVEKGNNRNTIWQVRHLPQNRELFATTGGGGVINLWQYNYPTKRISEDGDGNKVGVVGTLSLLQNVTISSQPINSLDWSPDKLGLAVCTAFDQTVRVLITTKLNLY